MYKRHVYIFNIIDSMQTELLNQLATKLSKAYFQILYLACYSPVTFCRPVHTWVLLICITYLKQK